MTHGLFLYTRSHPLRIPVRLAVMLRQIIPSLVNFIENKAKTNYSMFDQLYRKYTNAYNKKYYIMDLQMD
jgi:hypothetical protein